MGSGVGCRICFASGHWLVVEEVESRWHAGTGSRLRDIGLIFRAVAKRVCTGHGEGGRRNGEDRQFMAVSN